MRADSRFVGLGKEFWAHVRSLSQTLGYTVRGKGAIKVHTLTDIKNGMKKLDLVNDHLIESGKPTAFASQFE